MSHERFGFVLQDSRMITPRVRQLGFVREDGQPMPYIPGQFVTLHLPWEDMELRRSYSIATMPGRDGEIQIAVTYVEGGRATGILFDMMPGERVAATGPFGRFVLRDDPPTRYLLIATGTGISPYRAMLPKLEGMLATGNYQASLLLGVRGPDELLYGEDFRHLAKRQPAFHFHACYSRHIPENPAADELKGYVQDHLMSLSPVAGHDIVYLCGNPDMIDTAVTRLKAAGFDNRGLRREKYVSSN